jgi:formate-dependent nitrite reductase membrane component NrfD
VDLRLYGRVISRFRWLVIGGFALALVLTFLTVFKVNLGGHPWLSWRSSKTYQATSKVLLTPTTDPNVNATLYAQIVNSDVVRLPVLRKGPLGGTYLASAVSGGSTVGPLPIIEIDSTSTNPYSATRLARNLTNQFLSYLITSQATTRRSQRIHGQVITQPLRAVVTQGRKFTIPIVIFLSILVVALGLAFLLENLRPRSAVAVRELEHPPVTEESQDLQAAESPRPELNGGDGGDGGEGVPSGEEARSLAAARSTPHRRRG